MTEHPQTRFHGVDVDAAMVPLLRALWARGIRTVGSCQGWSRMNGAAYVSFVTEHDYTEFTDIVGSVSALRYVGEPDDVVRAKLAESPEYVEECAAKGGPWSVGFPPEDIGVVTAASRLGQESAAKESEGRTL